MSRLHRFDFASLPDFRAPVAAAPAVVAEEEETPLPPPPAPMFDETALEDARLQAKKEGYQEGYQAALAQSRQEADQRQEAAQHAAMEMVGQFKKLRADYDALIRTQSHEVGHLALAIARKVAGEALHIRDQHVIAELATQCLPVILAQPRLTIDLHPDTLPRLQDILREHLTQAGFEGEIIYRAIPTLGAHDTRMDWGNGSAIRDTDALWEQVASLLERVPIPITLSRETEIQPSE